MNPADFDQRCLSPGPFGRAEDWLGDYPVGRRHWGIPFPIDLTPVGHWRTADHQSNRAGGINEHPMCDCWSCRSWACSDVTKPT